jgi:hypothetical protein
MILSRFIRSRNAIRLIPYFKIELIQTMENAGRNMAYLAYLARLLCQVARRTLFTRLNAEAKKRSVMPIALERRAS